MSRTLFGLLLVSVLTNVSVASAADVTWGQVLENIAKKFPDARQLSTVELQKWLDDPDRKNPVLLDTRSEKEYEVSRLKNARLFVPGFSWGKQVKDISKDTAIVIYCSMGYRSSKMVQKMQDIGYTNVYNLRGSIFMWANEGRTVVRNGKVVKVIHPYKKKWGVLLNKQYHSTSSED